MFTTSHVLSGFLDELEKIAAAHGRMVVSKGRSGRRPISAAKLLAKDKKGKLFKKADAAGSPQDVRGDAGDDPEAAKLPKRQGEVPTRGANIPEDAKTGSVSVMGGDPNPFPTGATPAAPPGKLRLPGEVPSQDNIATDEPNGRVEQPATKFVTNDQSAKRPKKGDTPTFNRDMNIIDRGDLRESTTTVTGLAQNSSGIGAFNSPTEHT